MKKVLLTVLVALVAVSSWAVETPKSGFGVQIGWAQPILRLNDPTVQPKDSLAHVAKLNGFKIGLLYDESYVAGFGSKIGFNYTMAGGHTNWTQNKLSFSTRSQTYYQELELFVDWQYKFEIAKETYLTIYTGPTLQCGLMLQRNVYTRNEVTDEVTSNTYSAYTTDIHNEHLKRLNVTWGVGAEFQFRRYFVRGGYDFGLINPYKYRQFENSDRYTRGRFDQWSIKVGVFIWYDEN